MQTIIPDLLATKDAAAYLGISPKTMDNMRSRGKGPSFVKLGGTVRYRRSDLLDWIEANVRHTSRKRAA